VAGLIPQSFINDLIDRVDIVDVIDGRVALKKTGKNYSGLCPFHDEKSPSFSVSPDKQFFHCFGCQESGTALTFLMKYERMEFVEAVETLAKDMGLTVPREQSSRSYVEVDQGIYQALEGAEDHLPAGASRRRCGRSLPQGAWFDWRDRQRFWYWLRPGGLAQRQ
jgi:DNA primase